jgi:hypothetical protein
MIHTNYVNFKFIYKVARQPLKEVFFACTREILIANEKGMSTDHKKVQYNFGTFVVWPLEGLKI